MVTYIMHWCIESLGYSVSKGRAKRVNISKLMEKSEKGKCAERKSYILYKFFAAIFWQAKIYNAYTPNNILPI